MEIFMKGLLQWLTDHPEISVRTTYAILFYFFSTVMIYPSLIATSIAIPIAISRDLSSNAILLYSSKAISRFDYLLGKFFVLFGVMSITWLGPLLASWCLGNLMAPDWHFFWHSKLALFRMVAFVCFAMGVLSLIAMGVSAAAKGPRSATTMWLVLWLVPSVILVPISLATEKWLRYLSFTFDLKLIARKIFDIHSEISLAEQNVPVLGQMLAEVKQNFRLFWEQPVIGPGLLALGLMLAASCYFLWRKVRPE
jgi:ABC-type transport system involved in multi-copper enzyme maturation permease subunit